MSDTTLDDLAGQIGRVQDQLEMHRMYVEGTFVTKESLISTLVTLKFELISEMTRQMKAVFADAAEERLVQTLREYNESEESQTRFAHLLEHHRKLEKDEMERQRRKEREERLQDFNRIKNVVLYVLPFLTILNFVLQWLGIV